MNPFAQLKQITSVFLVAFAFACFGLLSTAQAVSPPPDGGYAHFTTAEGDNALNSLTTGLANTAVGWFSLVSVTTGSFNTGVGAGALVDNTGNENTATGTGALLLNTVDGNTANGAFALIFNTTGGANTAVGDRALQDNTTASFNTAVGQDALILNTTGASNTIVGAAAAVNNTTGTNNTSVGVNTLFSNVGGNENVAVGRAAMGANTGGNDNTAVGFFALNANTTGNGNTALGMSAGVNILDGIGDVAIGDGAGSTFVHAISSIAIGGSGVGPFADANFTCFIYDIDGQPTSDPASTVPVLIDSNNVLGTAVSSRRYKHDIKPMDKASEVILALKPVIFKYNSDQKGTPCFGLIAEDVAQVDPNLVVHNKNGELQTVRYEQINAMLLNEFLKEHKTVQEQGATIARLERQIEALTAGLQKVSAQLELSKSAPQTVLNNH